jgi:hypothetical protein
VELENFGHPMVRKEERDVNDWINILYQAWNKMLKHYARLGEQGGYYPSREEDMRSFLFSKILDVVDEKKLSLLDLHTEVSLKKGSRQRTDITLGWIDKNHCKLAIETKVHKGIKEDINKLKELIEDEHIEAGACLAVVLRPCDEKKPSRKLPLWETDIYREIETSLKIAQKDDGNNNFVKWKPIRRQGNVGTPNYWHVEFDAMFLILRKI